MKRYSIEELCNLYNAQSENGFENESSNLTGYVDNRKSTILSVRRIRDYLTKKILSSPERDGKKVYFTDKHLEDLKKIRELQSLGLSDSVMINYQGYESGISSSLEFGETKPLDIFSLSSCVEDDDLGLKKEDILSVLNNMQSQTKSHEKPWDMLKKRNLQFDLGTIFGLSMPSKSQPLKSNTVEEYDLGILKVTLKKSLSSYSNDNVEKINDAIQKLHETIKNIKE